MFLSQQFKIPDGCKLEKCAQKKGVRAKISVFILKNESEVLKTFTFSCSANVIWRKNKPSLTFAFVTSPEK